MHTACETALKSMGRQAEKAEIAFFGGSFTAIDPTYRRLLLEAAYPYIKSRAFSGIRISTRPDAISEEILTELRAYGVTSVELGAQSMDNEVLFLNERGHTAEEVERASGMIREAGFSLGLQMMTGLYGSSPEKDRLTAEKLIALRPETARIYPTLVMKKTRLGELWRAGEYRPQELEEAVELCADLLERFRRAKVKVIRVGLHAEKELQEGLLAGPFHPAFRELCESRIMLKKVLGCLEFMVRGEKKITVFVSPGAVSRMIGQKKQNLNTLLEHGVLAKVKTDGALDGLEIRIEENW